MIPLINPDVATFINVFTVEPTQQDVLVHRIQFDAENKISRQAGFIKAIIYRSLDGSKVINLVQWESIEASRAIHRNPDIAAGFASYQELGVEMDLRYYEIVLTEERPLTIQDYDALMAQVDVLHVAPENQQHLLEHLIHSTTPAIASQAEDQSTIWFRSLDGIRVIRFLHSHSRNAEPSFHQTSTNEKWIEQIDVNRYQIECTVTRQRLLA
ncbi:antibiotic biosynthesis monooxygenase [Oscillatoria sp. FACHB-1407]|uniref:antibiotic biosynthesis monooxygenase n=1 Tax=Oscillatoria sp. FACHB-1407 TaxID=2692847 RepID=UPI0016852C78|nr:antibiotic biosynthesis monooxygenase [Oscillatoria sp. FACHB-1407]